MPSQEGCLDSDDSTGKRRSERFSSAGQVGGRINYAEIGDDDEVAVSKKRRSSEISGVRHSGGEEENQVVDRSSSQNVDLDARGKILRGIYEEDGQKIKIVSRVRKVQRLDEEDDSK